MANNNVEQIILSLNLPKSVSQINADIKKLQKQLNSISISAKLNTDNAQKTGRQLGELVASWAQKAIEAGSKSIGRTLSDSAKAQAEKSVNLSNIFKAASSIVKNANTELREMNTILTEISRTNASLSKSDLSRIGNDSFETASRYGKTASAYLQDVRAMYRAGYDNAEAMAELSAAIQAAGELTAGPANSYITATDKAYQMNGSVAALKKTLDGANNITNINALDMSELASAMSAVSSQAAASQMEVNETTAAVAAMIAVTGKAGDELGNAFKGVLMNLQQVTGEAGDNGDSIDESSLAGFAKACNELGVALSAVRDGVVSLKEPMQILRELSEVYTKLGSSDARRTGLLSAVGGSDRADALNAILENYDLYEKMLQEYADGAGSMMAEAEKITNSWEGSLNRLGNTINNIVSNAEDSDLVIGAINMADKLLSVVNRLTDALGSLGTIGVGAGLFAGIQNTGIAYECM